MTTKTIYDEKERYRKLVLWCLPAIILLLVSKGISMYLGFVEDFTDYERVVISIGWIAMAWTSYTFGYAAGEENTVENIKKDETTNDTPNKTQ